MHTDVRVERVKELGPIILREKCYNLYYTHFEITGGPCNLIGSN